MSTRVYTFQNVIFTVGYERNFEKTTSFFSTTQGVPYDYDSVMHYSSHAFSTNDQATITPRDESVKLSRLGQREGFSHNDVLHVKALYCPGEKGWRGIHYCYILGSNFCGLLFLFFIIYFILDGTSYWSSWSGWSSCSQTCNGGTQVRTRACVGSTDCMGQNMEERTCNTDSCPERKQCRYCEDLAPFSLQLLSGVHGGRGLVVPLLAVQDDGRG